jgi:hypothetical protein
MQGGGVDIRHLAAQIKKKLLGIEEVKAKEKLGLRLLALSCVVMRVP